MRSTSFHEKFWALTVLFPIMQLSCPCPYIGSRSPTDKYRHTHGRGPKNPLDWFNVMLWAVALTLEQGLLVTKKNPGMCTDEFRSLSWLVCISEKKSHFWTDFAFRDLFFTVVVPGWKLLCFMGTILPFFVSLMNLMSCSNFLISVCDIFSCNFQSVLYFSIIAASKALISFAYSSSAEDVITGVGCVVVRICAACVALCILIA